jgi:hypothetical protein
MALFFGTYLEQLLESKHILLMLVYSQALRRMLLVYARRINTFLGIFFILIIKKAFLSTVNNTLKCAIDTFLLW